VRIVLVRAAAALVATAATLAAAVPVEPAVATDGKILIAVGESSWGSIVAQLAGSRASVTSIITNPNTDPHGYEPTPGDARDVASAGYVVENGAGYDPWMQQLVDANPDDSRQVLDVAKLLHVPDGGNPHQWYSARSVELVADRVTADLVRLDRSHRAFYEARRTEFETRGLARYRALIDDIRARYAGTAIGASESIVTPLARTLGLDLVTPRRFLDAIAEGTEPTAGDKATVDAQLTRRQVKVFVFNSQNGTPDVRRLVGTARAEGIPVTRVTETLSPAGATFQAWQVAQLTRLESALARAAG
jgi:zinc/manganese transport system substrate-binding protein